MDVGEVSRRLHDLGWSVGDVISRPDGLVWPVTGSRRSGPTAAPRPRCGRAAELAEAHADLGSKGYASGLGR
jgi:hypothetical protein